MPVSDSAIHSMAGAVGGMVAMAATYPLIFLSTRAAVETKKEHKSTYQAIVDIIKREGVLGLYSGLNSSLLGIAVTNGVYYYFYERTKGAILLKSDSKNLSTMQSILTGIIAGSATSVAVNPFWVIQTAQAVETMGPSQSSGSAGPSPSASKPKRLGFIQTVERLIAQDGISALWRGIGPALILVVNPVIQYTVFEQLKNLLVKKRTERLRKAGVAAAVAVLTDWDFFLLGAISKLIASASTYPYIVVKSRLQAGRQHSAKYKSSYDAIVTILREEGIHGLYKGIGSKLTQSVLTAAILFMSQRRIYEITKKALLPAATH